MESQVRFAKDLSKPAEIPAAAIARVQELMVSGRLHRYGEDKGSDLEVAALEREFAAYTGQPFCVALNSCGCGLFVALKCLGVGPGVKVLTNSFTLAPVPGAIAHCNAEPILVETNEDYVIDLADLQRKAAASGATILLLSHMRGHLADMEAVVSICRDLGIILVEDCAHAMGATWNDQMMGTFGAAGVFSSQSFKQINSGEGGLLVTNDEDIAAKAILYSGSYMLYRQHGARPDEAVFARWRGIIPNFSLRMTNLAAALLRPQLPLLGERAEIWKKRYGQLASRLGEIPGVSLPVRPEKEGFIANSIQFRVEELTMAQMEQFQSACQQRGVFLKWFGDRAAAGFTSSHHHWQYLAERPELPQTDSVLRNTFDMRIPLDLTDDDVDLIAIIITRSLDAALQAPI